MASAALLLDQLTAAFDGDPWHGPSLRAILADLTAADAAARPVPGAHSILELVLHITGWKEEVVRRLQGESAGTPPQGDWPPVPADLERGWGEALAALTRAHEALVAEVRRLGDAGLEHSTRDSRPGVATPPTRWQTAIGILQHDVYHGGQIALLKRALRS